MKNRICYFSAESCDITPKCFLRDIAAYSDGSWRMYDDTATIDPVIQSAGWIVAGDLPRL